MAHLISLSRLPVAGTGRYRDLRKAAISSGVRWSRGMSRTLGPDGPVNGGTIHGVVIAGDSCV